MSWDNNERSDLERSKATCGPFEFEIRAWDLASDDTLEIRERFDISKTGVRAGIRAPQGNFHLPGMKFWFCPNLRGLETGWGLTFDA